MINAVKNTINHILSKPKTLFLIDGLGAMLTAFLLFVVLRNFNEYFGMPKLILTYLSIIAMCFCIYATTCFFFLKGNWIPFIKVISYANLLYCMLTILLLICYYPMLTTIGLIYFLIEVAIILVLTSVEFKVATTLQQKAQNTT